jgi:hypothetical protein
VGELQALRGRVYPGLIGWAWLGAVLVAGAAVASWLYDRQRRTGVIVTVCASAVLFIVLTLGGAIGAVDRYKAPRQLAGTLPADHLSREVRLATYDWFQPSLVFYVRREVERPERLEQVFCFLNQPLPAYLFVPEPTWNQIESRMPPRTCVVARRRDLYTGRVIVVVSNGVDEGVRELARRP